MFGGANHQPKAEGVQADPEGLYEDGLDDNSTALITALQRALQRQNLQSKSLRK